MKTFIKSLFFIAALSLPFSVFAKTIAIIVPLEHAALQAIVDGFKATMEAEYKQPVTIKVGNAMGDTQMQRSIIQQFANQKVDMFVPLGLATFQMNMAMVKETPIVGLAANYSESDRQKRNPRNVTGVHDELGGAAQMKFMQGIFPKLKKMTLVHSNAEKIFKEVSEIEALAKKAGIEVQKLAINTLPDLYSASKNIESDTQAILILKDHMIVSGVGSLAKVADEKKIPLVTADEGSISGGGAVALGVSEKAVGVQGAKLAIQILNGKPIADLPMENPAHPSVFLNKAAATRQGLDIAHVIDYAKKNNYPLVEILEKKA